MRAGESARRTRIYSFVVCPSAFTSCVEVEEREKGGGGNLGVEGEKARCCDGV
jgi:hypothetical protein